MLSALKVCFLFLRFLFVPPMLQWWIWRSASLQNSRASMCPKPPPPGAPSHSFSCVARERDWCCEFFIVRLVSQGRTVLATPQLCVKESKSIASHRCPLFPHLWVLKPDIKLSFARSMARFSALQVKRKPSNSKDIRVWLGLSSLEQAKRKSQFDTGVRWEARDFNTEV